MHAEVYDRCTLVVDGDMYSILLLLQAVCEDVLEDARLDFVVTGELGGIVAALLEHTVSLQLSMEAV